MKLFFAGLLVVSLSMCAFGQDPTTAIDTINETTGRTTVATTVVSSGQITNGATDSNGGGVTDSNGGGVTDSNGGGVTDSNGGGVTDSNGGGSQSSTVAPGNTTSRINSGCIYGVVTFVLLLHVVLDRLR